MKYRVWCKNKNEWEKDETLLDSDGELNWFKFGGITPVNMDNHSIDFSSGKVGKNKEELFEGDYVIDEEGVLIVVYNEQDSKWTLCDKESCEFVFDFADFASLEDFEKVGNYNEGFTAEQWHNT